MKKPATLVLLTAILISLFFSPIQSTAQAHVNSSTGYSVGIFVMPVSILPSTNSCPWGFNYNVRVNYSVSFSGTNIPAALYTLQGYIKCGPNNNFFDLPNNGGVGTVTTTSNPWISNATCNSASVNSLNCNTAKIDISGPGISARTVTIPITYVALPVNLTAFEATIIARKVKLDWKTASEANSKDFTIERSTDGLQWQKLGTVAAAGQSDSIRSYQMIDDHPIEGLSYYRLSLSDIDGRESFSGIKTIQLHDGKKMVSLYPVPNSGNTIHLVGLSEPSQYRVSVINNCGTTVFSSKLNSTSIDVVGLKAGLYVVSLQNTLSGETQTLRYVKL